MRRSARLADRESARKFGIPTESGCGPNGRCVYRRLARKRAGRRGPGDESLQGFPGKKVAKAGCFLKVFRLGSALQSNRSDETEASLSAFQTVSCGPKASAFTFREMAEKARLTRRTAFLREPPPPPLQGGLQTEVLL